VRFLLDTSALLAHHRREPGGMRVQELFEESGSEILVASISLTELARRLRELGATPGEARVTVAEYRAVLDNLVVVDERVAFAAFDLGCETPERLPLADALIAAAAREHGACLVHRDRHMASIPASLLEQLDLATVSEEP
jgi:predicted nucleic acid-binding protein